MASFAHISLIAQCDNSDSPGHKQNMRYPFPSLILLLICSVACLSPARCSPSAPSKDPYQGFFLEGTGDFGTKCTVSICKAGSRYYDLGRDCAVLSAPPKWEAYMVNSKRKIYMPLSKMRTKNQLKLLNANLHGSDAKWETAPDTTFLNHKVHAWIMYTAERPEKGKEASDYWKLLAMDELPIPAALSKANSDMHSIPLIGFHPVYLFHRLPSGKRDVYLQATSIKPAKFRAEDFTIPKGYNLTSNEADLSLEMDGISDFIDAVSDPRMRDK